MKTENFPGVVHVIGGGVIGLCSAFELARSGVRTVVLDRQTVGREASWAGGGILSPLYPWRYPDAVNVLAQWSQARYSELRHEFYEQQAIDAEWFRCGMQVLGVLDSDVAIAWAARFNVSLQRLDSGGDSLWLPDIAQVRTPRLIRALRAALVSMGVELVENATVSRISVHNGRVNGLHSEDGQFLPTHCCVVAAGPWTTSLLHPTGLTLSIEPVRGQMLLYRAQPGVLDRIILHDQYYLIPRRDGRILAGSTLEYAGFNRDTTERARVELHEQAVGLLPALADFPIERQWAGLRPSSPEGVPYIGEHPNVKGLWVSAGHYRNGIVLAPASARLLSDLMLGREPIVDPRPYALAGR